MDKALKQRLVGASVLVALAVIILPMLLSGQADRAKDSREIEIPARPAELSFEKRRFPIGEQPATSPSTVPVQSAESTDQDPGAPASQNNNDSRPRSLQERLEEVAAANEVVSPALPERDGSEAQDVSPAVNPEAARGSPAEIADPIADPITEPVAAIVPQAEPEPATPPSSEPVAEVGPVTGRYLVQVASFSSTGNANRLANTLRESGLPVLMDTVESAAGTLNRVRVGPFTQRAEADQVLARLANQIPDVRPRLVDLRPDEEAPITDMDDPLIRWVVQVGVFSAGENAEKLVFSLRDAGYRAVSRAETADGTTRYRVLVGPEVNRAAAVALADRLLSEQGIKGIVQSTE